MDLTSKNHNHNSFDQRLKWIQLPKITTLWSQTQMDPTYQNHNTLITDPNGSNFPESQHFDQRPKWIQTSQNHNTLITDPNGSNFPKSQHLDQRLKMHPTSRKPSQKNNILMWVLGVLIHSWCYFSFIGCMEIVFLTLGATIFWPGLIIALPNKNTLPIYLSTLAQFDTNYIVFRKCWKFSKIIFFQIKKYCEGKNKWIF
jgi:hypothetical protein